MTKRRLLSSVAAAATIVGSCLFLAPTAQAAQTSGCTGPGGTVTLMNFLTGNFTCTGTDSSTGKLATVTCTNFKCARVP